MSLAALINLALQAGIGLDGSSVANAPTQQDMGNNSQERCEAGHVVNSPHPMRYLCNTLLIEPSALPDPPAKNRPI